MPAEYLSADKDAPLFCVKSRHLLQRGGTSTYLSWNQSDESITQCAKLDWSVPATPGDPTHKMLCGAMKVLGEYI